MQWKNDISPNFMDLCRSSTGYKQHKSNAVEDLCHSSTGSLNSVVVMDNCSIHHIEPVTSLLENAGVVTMFLPPYCPDLNPIEEVFSLVKGYLRKHNNIIQHLPHPEDIIKEAFASLTADHCTSFIEHAGYVL